MAAMTDPGNALALYKQAFAAARFRCNPTGSIRVC
jgi:hypothetical protein